MIKVRILTILFALAFAMQAFCSSPVKEDNKENNKVVLSYLDLTDAAVEFAAFDVNGMILRKSKGFMWPATKITFSKDADKLLFVVTAIDNSWCNMFPADEVAHGYFIVNGRLFIVSTKGEVPAEFSKFFTLNTEIKEKTFYKADAGSKPVAKNPVWTYLHRGDQMATVLDSVYTENLGR